jgi:hypothetical protein
MSRPLTVERHEQMRAALIRAERAAAFVCATARGQSAAEIAAAVASRVFAALRAQARTEAAEREVAQ